jgi:hypothetical protein
MNITTKYNPGDVVYYFEKGTIVRRQIHHITIAAHNDQDIRRFYMFFPEDKGIHENLVFTNYRELIDHVNNEYERIKKLGFFDPVTP